MKETTERPLVTTIRIIQMLRVPITRYLIYNYTNRYAGIVSEYVWFRTAFHTLIIYSFDKTLRFPFHITASLGIVHIFHSILCFKAGSFHLFQCSRRPNDRPSSRKLCLYRARNTQNMLNMFQAHSSEITRHTTFLIRALPLVGLTPLRQSTARISRVKSGATHNCETRACVSRSRWKS